MSLWLGIGSVAMEILPVEPHARGKKNDPMLERDLGIELAERQVCLSWDA